MATGEGKRPNTSPPKRNLAKMPSGSQKSPSQDQQNSPQPRNQPPPQMQTVPAGGAPPDLHHVGAATSIAHAILARRGGM